MITEQPDGAINSANCVFTLRFLPRTGSVTVFVDGVAQTPDTDYEIVENVITMTQGPLAGSTMLVTYYPRY